MQAKTHTGYTSKLEAAAADILKGRYFQALQKIYLHSVSGKRDFLRLIQSLVQKEKKQLGSAPSVLRGKDSDIKSSLADFEWNPVVDELERKCPTLNAALKGATTTSKTIKYAKARKTRSKTIRGVITAIIAYHYNPVYVTNFQKLNTVLMWTGGCDGQV